MTRSDDCDSGGMGARSRVLVLGAYGMLGHKLAQVLRHTHEVYGTIRQSEEDPAFDRALSGVSLLTGVEAEDPASVAAAIARTRPAAIVNCIGLTKQRMGETDTLTAIELNAAFPHRLAELAEQGGARLVHFSTDCVFSGRDGNYSEKHAADARDLYGLTKSLGEVRGRDVLTLRSSIVGHELGRAFGLLEWFLDQAGGSIKGYDAAVFSGLTTVAMATLVRDLLVEHPDLEGLWHVSGEPISKFEFLTRVRSAYGVDVRIERDTDLRLDRSLDSCSLQGRIGWNPPTWADMIEELHADFLANKAYYGRQR